MKGLDEMMKQVQSMQEDVQNIQNEIANSVILGESGAGMVKVSMTGRYDVRNIELDPSLLTEEKNFLEDLLAAAVNDAVRKVESLNKEKMGGIASGLNFPPGFKMPF